MATEQRALSAPALKQTDRPAQQWELPLNGSVADGLRTNGDIAANSNVIQAADTPIHAWYRFVQSYPPHLVRKYLERFGVRLQ